MRLIKDLFTSLFTDPNSQQAWLHPVKDILDGFVTYHAKVLPWNSYFGSVLPRIIKLLLVVVVFVVVVCEFIFNETQGFNKQDIKIYVLLLMESEK